MKHFERPATLQGKARGDTRPSDGLCPPTRPETWHKWDQILPALRSARRPLALNKSRLDLLEKLMACVPTAVIGLDRAGELIVHVSNAKLALMTNRDGPQIITRLLGELEATGLIARKLSPNGKRYCRTAPDGTHVAFGIDLAPLIRRMPEIDALAHRMRLEAEACAREREACSLLLTRLATSESGAAHQDIASEGRKLLRRKPVLALLKAFRARIEQTLGIELVQSEPESDLVSRTDKDRPTQKIGGSASQNACHKDTVPIQSDRRSAQNSFCCQLEILPRKPERPAKLTPEFVERALPRAAQLGRSVNGSLRDFTGTLQRYLAISDRVWKSALSSLGFESGALLLMVLYERQRSIRNPSGYLVSLLKTVQSGAATSEDVLTRAMAPVIGAGG